MATHKLTGVQRQQLACCVAQSGSIDNMEQLVRVLGPPRTSHVLAAAAAGGHVPLCRWLLGVEPPCPPDDCTLAAAAATGQLPVCTFLVEELGVRPGPLALCAAAEGGHDEVCSYLLGWGEGASWFEWGRHVARGAARRGHTHILEPLLEQAPAGALCSSALLCDVLLGCPLATFRQLQARLDASGWQAAAPALGRMLGAAAGSATPDWRDKVALVLSLPGCPTSSPEPCCRAAWLPDAAALPRLRHLRADRGLPLGADCVAVAARLGSADTLRWLLAPAAEGGGGLVAELGAVLHAAQGGHVGALEVLEEAGGCRVVPEAVRQAASAGRLEAVRWGVGRLGAAALTAEVMLAALQSGCPEVVSYLVRQGCGMDERCVEAAVRDGSGEQVEELVAAGCPVGTAWLRPPVLRLLLRRGAAGLWARLGSPPQQGRGAADHQPRLVAA